MPRALCSCAGRIPKRCTERTGRIEAKQAACPNKQTKNNSWAGGPGLVGPVEAQAPPPAREKCENRAGPRRAAPELGSRHENGNPELKVRRGWPARAGMASSGPLPGSDAKKPACSNDAFLTNAVVCPRARWGAGRGRADGRDIEGAAAVGGAEDAAAARHNPQAAQKRRSSSSSVSRDAPGHKESPCPVRTAST